MPGVSEKMREKLEREREREREEQERGEARESVCVTWSPACHVTKTSLSCATNSKCASF